MYQKINKMVLDLQRRGRSKNTIQNMVYTLNKFALYCNKSPEDITENDIINYLDYCLNDLKLCKSTVNIINSFLKFFYVVTLERTWSDLKIPRLKANKTLPVYLTKTEVDSIISSISNLKHKAIISTIYSSGLRLSEALNLRVSDIISSEMKIRIRNGKGGKERYTILSQNNLYILRDYWKNSNRKNYTLNDYLFPGIIDGKPLSTHAIQTLMRKSIKELGINKHATPHSLRHSFATHLMNDGVDLITIQALMGHISLKSTSIYLHLTNHHLLNVKSPFDRIP